MNQRYVLTTVKLKDLLSHKVQTQNLLFTFTWNVKRPQNNFVPIFNSKVGVRLIHECDLYSSKYGNSFFEMGNSSLVTNWQFDIKSHFHVKPANGLGRKCEKFSTRADHSPQF